MATQTYDIIFEGEAADGIDPETAKRNLQQLFKVDRARIDQLFCGNRTVLKKAVSADVAQKYRSALASAGVKFSTDPELDAAAAPAAKPGGPNAGNAANPYAPPRQNAAVARPVFCRSCGAAVDGSAKTCPACGAKQQVGKPKSKVTAALLAIFLGFLGIHRFYLGQWIGILYLIFGFLAWPVAWVEAIVFLAADRERWDRKYGNVVGGGAGMVIVCAVLVIAIIGIVAAAAIPAYNDYVQRSKVAQAIAAAQPAIDRIEAFAGREKFFPDSNAQAGVDDGLAGESLASLAISENGVITMTFAASSDAVDGKTLLWVPALDGDAVRWDCSGGTLARRHRPNRCQDGAYSGQQVAANRQWVTAEDHSARVKLPTNWKNYPDLNEIAGIEFASLQREQYFIALAEPKSDFTDNMDVYSYNDLLLENFHATVDKLQIKYLGEVEINKMRGLKHELRGEIDNVKVVYLLLALEGRNHYHQLVFWSTASRWKSSLGVFEEVLASYAECDAACGG